MSLAVVHTRALAGIDAAPVDVEVHLAGGLPAMSIVGLPETAVKESKDRVRAALMNAGFDYPARRITVNLAPADLPKQGGRYDLPIALGVLVASGQLPRQGLAACEFIGELALSGALRPVRGALPTALAAARAGRALVLPADNAAEAAMVAAECSYTAPDLLAVSAHLSGRCELARATVGVPANAPSLPDLGDVRGQAQARRALELAAAGAHNLLLVGPPGTGKSMLAARLPSLLPPMSEDEALESAAVASVSIGFDPAQWRRRAFRQPHHTASSYALVGGGSLPRPGEISLAHNGVLFLDELPEFNRHVLESLREPLESGRIVIARAAQRAEFPARFQLVAAMNPCPCGYAGDEQRECRCAPAQIERYRARVSGPLLDRIDLVVRVPRVAPELLRRAEPEAPDSATVAARVAAARGRALARGPRLNAHLDNDATLAACPLDRETAALLDDASRRLQLSPRAYHKALKVARTIADLDDRDHIAIVHLGEALAYRGFAATL